MRQFSQIQPRLHLWKSCACAACSLLPLSLWLLFFFVLKSGPICRALTRSPGQRSMLGATVCRHSYKAPAAQLHARLCISPLSPYRLSTRTLSLITHLYR